MEPSNRTPGGFGRRVWQVALEEVGDISARRIAINAISRTLPQLSLGRVRTATLRALGLSLGARALVMGPIHVTGKGDVRELVSFGSDVVVTGGLHLDIGGEIRVGDQVYLGHDVALLTVDHRIGPPGRRCAAPTLASVTIGDGCWIAARATILPGVSVGAGSVVAAGAVVTRDVEKNVLVGGVPARLIRRLDDDERAGSA